MAPLKLGDRPGDFLRRRWEELDLQAGGPIKDLKDLRQAVERLRMGLVDPIEGNTWYTAYGLSRDGPGKRMYFDAAPVFVAYMCNREHAFIMGKPLIEDTPDGYTVSCKNCGGELEHKTR